MALLHDLPRYNRPRSPALDIGPPIWNKILKEHDWLESAGGLLIQLDRRTAALHEFSTLPKRKERPDVEEPPDGEGPDMEERLDVERPDVEEQPAVEGRASVGDLPEEELEDLEIRLGTP